MTAERTAVILLTGSELLDGRVRDRNGAFLAVSLNAQGTRVLHMVFVGDDPRRLEDGLRFALACEPDLVVVSGGLGTTHDDLTAAVVAETTGRALGEDPEAFALVAERTRALASRRGLAFEELLKHTRRQALLPAGAAAIAPAGVAPGFALDLGRTRLFALPGVPTELEEMWRDVVARLEDEEFFLPRQSQVIRICDVGEIAVAQVLEEVAGDHLEVGLAASHGEVSVSVTHLGDAAGRAQAERLVRTLQRRLPVFSTDGRTVDELVADVLRSASATVAVAESCTGGLLGARLTAAAGSSDYFVGGVISYADTVKEALLTVPQEMLVEHGAVSAPVAACMAEGVRAATGATYGVSTTGIAGPGGGSPAKPVGEVFIGCAGPEHTTTRELHLPGNREAVRTATVTYALHLLREEMRA